MLAGEYRCFEQSCSAGQHQGYDHPELSTTRETQWNCWAIRETCYSPTTPRRHFHRHLNAQSLRVYCSFPPLDPMHLNPLDPMHPIHLQQPPSRRSHCSIGHKSTRASTYTEKGKKGNGKPRDSRETIEPVGTNHCLGSCCSLCSFYHFIFRLACSMFGTAYRTSTVNGKREHYRLGEKGGRGDEGGT